MSVFSPAEIAYLWTQRLGRLATVGPSGQPHVVPVGFRYNSDEDTIDIGGHDFSKRKKFRDLQANGRVAFVVDDLATVSPWHPRGIEVRGRADVLTTGGEAFGRGYYEVADRRTARSEDYDATIFRIRPRRIVSWGLEGGARRATVRP